jgi:DnaK suppressor protein
MLKHEFVQEMKTKLLEAKAKLEGDLKGLHAHTELGTDQGENAEEVELDDVNRDLMGRMQADIEKIDKALSKIEAGTYGVDDEGKEISEERLRVLPWADKAI